MPIYDKPVRLLMRDMVAAMGLEPGQVVLRDEVVEWFRTNFPLVKEGTVHAHLLHLSTNAKTRVHYNAKEDGSDDVFFQLDSSRFRLYQPGVDPVPIYRNSIFPPPPPPPDDTGGSEFAYERDLREYLARNLHLIEPGLKLYREEGVTGIEFPAGGRFIDILAMDTRGGYVVVELKVSRGHDRVVGQLLRYMGWIEEHQAEADQSVRGVIVAKEVSEDLRLACRRIADVGLFEYALSVSLMPVARP